MTRTRSGNLELASTNNPDNVLIIAPGLGTIRLIASDRDPDTGRIIEVDLAGADLDALAAEILRIRDENQI